MLYCLSILLFDCIATGYFHNYDLALTLGYLLVLSSDRQKVAKLQSQS